MKLFRLVILLLTILTCQSQLRAQSPARESKKKFSDMVGAWQIREATDKRNQAVASTSTPMDWILFTREGKFKSRLGSTLDSGSYRMNEPNAILYLQSDANKKVSEWAVSFAPGVMTLNSKDKSGPDQNKYVYVRSHIVDPKELRHE